MLPRTRSRIALLEAALTEALDREDAELVERSRNWLDGQMTRRVLVQINAGPGEADSIEGLVARVAPDGLVLEHAVFHDADGRTVPMAGEVWLPRPKVRLVQTLPTMEVDA